MKKIYLLLLALMSCIGAAWAADGTPQLSGSGTEADPWIIATKADVLELARLTNPTAVANASHFKGKYFKMTADIDMTLATGEAFLGIGGAPAEAACATGYYFAGNFDGNGHKIKNLIINGAKLNPTTGDLITAVTANNSRNWVGFFNRLDSTAVVKNLIIDSSCHFLAINYAGGIAGYMQPGTTIQNCQNYGTVRAYVSYAGGIAGYMSGSSTKPAPVIEGCLNGGNVFANKTYAGGITAYLSYCSLKNCANIGNVYATQFFRSQEAGIQQYAGGIVSYAGYGSTLENCVNAGNVFAAKQYSAGIAATTVSFSTYPSSVKNCVNYGTFNLLLNYNYEIGAISSNVGTSPTQYPAISNCYYDGQMVSQTIMGVGNVYITAPAIVKKSTAELTSGTPLPDFGAEWTFKAGQYPVLTQFAEEMKAAASTYVTFPSSQAADFCSGTATLSAGTTATLKQKKCWSVQNGAIVAGTFTDIAMDTVTLKNGSFSRTIIIGGYPQAWVKGAGTQASPYTISSKEDMLNLQKISASELRLDFDGQYISLAQDLDMENDTSFHGLCFHFNRIVNAAGRFTRQFRGTFDGNGHKISHMFVNNMKFDADGVGETFVKGSGYFNGLFGSIGRGALVQNVTIDSTCLIAGHSYSGGIAGYGQANAHVKNCHVQATFNCYGPGNGGIVGTSGSFGGVPYTPDLLIEDCSFSGYMKSCTGYTGGIISVNYGGTVRNCVNAGVIHCETFNALVKPDASNLNFVGGICMQNSGIVENCASYGSVYSVKGTTGGIAGQLTNANSAGGLNHCLATGTVKCAEDAVNVGQMVGVQYRDSKFPDSPVNGCIFDSQLAYVDTACGGAVGLDAPFAGMTTSALTSGQTIAELGNGWSFEAGYYPIPATLKNIPEVRAAACTFLSLPAGQTVNHFINGTLNNVMPIQASFADGNFFRIKGLEVYGRYTTDEKSDVLNLTNGLFKMYYPLTKPGNTNVQNPLGEETVKVEYFTAEGYAVANPAAGALLIKVSTLTSGKRVVEKVIIR